MPKVAFCKECKRYVEVTDAGCKSGHPLSALSDVRDIADGEPMPGTVGPAGSSQLRSGSGAWQPSDRAMNVAAKAFVIIPAAIVFGLILWASVEGEIAMGMSVWPAILAAVGSLALTFAYFYVRLLGRHR